MRQANPDSRLLPLQLLSNNGACIPWGTTGRAEQKPLFLLLDTFMGPTGQFGKKLYME